MIAAVQRALDSVTDDTALDWSALHAESTVDPDIDLTLRALHDIAAIAKAHHHPHGSLPALPFTWGPLEAREFVARGAHGDIYRAWDPRLERDVALKLLRAGSSAERPYSIAEGRLLARIRHPHVVAVYGADRVNGQDGIWMELVEGRTLRETIEHDGPMPARDAVRVAAELCDGLAAVHAAGLIHRDVKAQNVVVDRAGRTILMDLGAGMDEAADPASKEGTPIYLAPELLEGAAPGRASDIYAVGVLIFFLVTGRYPVMAVLMPDLRAAHRDGRRERLSGTRIVPHALAALIDSALEPVPSDRPADAAALARALREAAAVRPRRARTIAAAVLALAASVGGLVWIAASTSPPLPAEREWVLIAPFQNLTGEPQFSGSVEAALAHELSASSYVNVVPPERVEDALRLMRHDRAAPIDERVAREAALRDGEVDFVAAGAVSKRGGGYALALRLVDPSSGGTVAAEEWAFTGPSEVGDALRGASQWLRRSAGVSAVRGEAVPFDKGTTRSLEASRLFADALRSARLARWGEADAALNAALQIDPEFASAHTWKAWATANLGRTEDARASARRALDLAANVSPRERAFIRASFFLLHQDAAQALGELEAMTRRYPDDYWAAHKLGQLYGDRGRLEDFREVALRVRALRPRDLVAHAEAVRSVILTRGAAAAAPMIEEALRLRREMGAGAPDMLETGYLDLLPVHVALSALDTAQATRLLDAVDAAAPDDEPDWQRFRRSSFRLALGQLRKAASAIAGVRNVELRRLGTGWIHMAGEDRASALALMRDYRGFDYAGVSMLVCAGDLDAARRLLAHLGDRHQPTARWTRAQIDVASVNTQAARQLLREGADVLRGITGVRAFLYAETLADGLLRAGRPDEAAEVLGLLTPLREHLFNTGGSTGGQWLLAQKRLADLHRQQRHPELAIPIEREMLAVLASADPDHPLLISLRARR